MGLFSKRLPKNENSRAYRRAAAEKYDGLLLHYVTERLESGEVVLGRGGSVSVRNGEVIVLCAQEIVFRCPAEALDASDLLSGNGAVFRGVDTLCGKERTLVVHFSYYRK